MILFEVCCVFLKYIESLKYEWPCIVHQKDPAAVLRDITRNHLEVPVFGRQREFDKQCADKHISLNIILNVKMVFMSHVKIAANCINRF